MSDNGEVSSRSGPVESADVTENESLPNSVPVTEPDVDSEIHNGVAPADDIDEKNNEENNEENSEEYNKENSEEEYQDDVHKLQRHRRKPSATESTSDSGELRKRPAKPATTKEGRRSKKSGSSAASTASVASEEPEEEVDEAVKERRALEARIDAVLQPSSKRRKKLAGDDLEMMQDEVIAKLRDDMRAAALADVESIREGQPAVHKMKMLPEVVHVLQKGSLADSILDGNLLEGVRVWLEPLPDASLPSFEIQKVLFGALVKLPIKTIHLRESGLGRVVLFYQKSKRPHPAIKRLAQKLIGDWTRPIIGRSDNYRDKRIATASFDPRDARKVLRSSDGQPRTSYEESAARRNRAAIPSSSGISYMVAPVSSASTGNNGGSQAVSKDAQLRRMKTKLMASGRSGRKKSQVSVEGKDLH